MTIICGYSHCLYRSRVFRFFYYLGLAIREICAGATQASSWTALRHPWQLTSSDLRGSSKTRPVKDSARPQVEQRVYLEEAGIHTDVPPRKVEKGDAEQYRRKAEGDAERADKGRARAAVEGQRAQQEHRKADLVLREAERAAADARASREEAERSLRKGIHPTVIGMQIQFRVTKLRLQYKKGSIYFAVARIVRSGRISLINTFRGLWTKEGGNRSV